jgi:hypothetical protein
MELSYTKLLAKFKHFCVYVSVSTNINPVGQLGSSVLCLICMHLVFDKVVLFFPGKVIVNSKDIPVPGREGS